jgi:hypothetical protein
MGNIRETHGVGLYGVPAARHDCGENGRKSVVFVMCCQSVGFTSLQAPAAELPSVREWLALRNDSEDDNARSLPASGLFTGSGIEFVGTSIKRAHTTIVKTS